MTDWRPLLDTVGPVVVILATVAVLARVFAPAAYLAARNRTRAAETAKPGHPAVRERQVQFALAEVLDRMDDDSPGAAAMRRVVLGDRVALSAGVLAGLPDPEERLAFIWFVRPSQPDDYPRSREFLGLPTADSDAVVLLDLRRSLMLRGAEATFSAGTGFYHHDRDLLLGAAARSGNGELHRHLSAIPSTPDTAKLLALVNAPLTWARFLAG